MTRIIDQLTHEEAHDAVARLVDDAEHERIDMAYVYDRRSPTRATERYMTAGNGPTEWVWFISDGDVADEITCAFLEFHSGGETALVPIPDYRQAPLRRALRKAWRAYENRYSRT